jgi:hypothetical protein
MGKKSTFIKFLERHPEIKLKDRKDYLNIRK